MSKLLAGMVVNATYCLHPEKQTVHLQPLKLADLYGVFILYFAGKMTSIFIEAIGHSLYSIVILFI